MMDFEAEPEFEEEEVLAVLRYHCGVLLETDYSFHFWGFNLMTELEWRQFMVWCCQEERQRQVTRQNSIFDIHYIEISILRGWAALRLFGYKDTQKECEPWVVEMVGG